MKVWFGEWLTMPVRCNFIRVVIEQMSERSKGAGCASLEVKTQNLVRREIIRSSGNKSWPWRAEKTDSMPWIGMHYSMSVEVTSLKIEQVSDTDWVRRYRIEVSNDGKVWSVTVSSRLIDAYHRQPVSFFSGIEVMESKYLPPDHGTNLANKYFYDFFLRTLEPLGMDSGYPDWIQSRFIIGAAAWPTFFNGVYSPGDCGCFNPLIASIYQPEIAIENQKMFPQVIKRFGFMPGVMIRGKDDSAFWRDYSSMIWGPQCYWDIWSWTRSRELLESFTPAVAKWSRWWLTNRDRNGDGWIEPGLNGCRPSLPGEIEELRKKHNDLMLLDIVPEAGDYVGIHKSYPALQLSIWECPWDDAPENAWGRNYGVRFDPETLSVNIHFIESQLYNAVLDAYCARASALTGKNTETSFFRREAQRLAALVRDHCWDEKTGFYYDRDIATGKLRTFVKHAGAFYPMMMGLCTEEQAGRMVEHLTNPDEFWTSYPVPTLSRDSFQYDPDHYWSGRAWPPINFTVLRALLNYGYFEIADELLKRWMASLKLCFDRPKQGVFTYNCDEPSQKVKDQRYAVIPDCEIISPENWNPENAVLRGSPGLTWGGLWLPSLIIRNFWPVGDHEVLLRPGGFLHLKLKDRWTVKIEGCTAEINGRFVRMSEGKTFLLDENTGILRSLPPGKADPCFWDCLL